MLGDQTVDTPDAMASNDHDLEELTSRLHECLGRIDEEAYRIQGSGDGVDFDCADRLEGETATLQHAVDSLLVADLSAAEVDINQAVARAIDTCLQSVTVPIILRQKLCGETLLASAPAGPLAVAIQRAIVFTISHLKSGDEILLTTRADSGSALIEIEGYSSHENTASSERSETLRDFISNLGGCCQVRTEHGNLYLVIELPQVIVTDRTESS